MMLENSLYESCAILGGTLMPHTIYLGSGLVQARMRAFDRKNNRYQESAASDSKFAIMIYRPSLSAIKSCMSYSIAELCITLFIVAVFVNSAILIVSAAAFSDDADQADLPGMYALFVSTVSQASGTVFALALLFSGITSGIVATLAGQLVCEGALNWRMSPFLRRLLTRSLAIVPGIIIAGAEGQQGLAAALVGCNVVLSVSLIFLTFPLVLYTSSHKYMSVQLDGDGDPAPGNNVVAATTAEANDDAAAHDAPRTTSFANNWLTAIIGWLIWLLIAGMNVSTLVFVGQGVAGD
jgi:metal iron transporter